MGVVLVDGLMEWRYLVVADVCDWVRWNVAERRLSEGARTWRGIAWPGLRGSCANIGRAMINYRFKAQQMMRNCYR